MTQSRTGYDPYAVQARKREQQQAEQQLQQELADRAAMWTAARIDAVQAMRDCDAGGLLRFGSTLKEFECGLWLDFYECWLERESIFEWDDGPSTEYERFRGLVVAMKVLRAAFDEKPDALRVELGHVSDHGLAAFIASRLNGEVLSDIERWIGGHLPATPPILAAELTKACAGRKAVGNGFSKGNVAKRDLELERAQIVEHKKKEYVRFFHPTKQREVLQLVVKFLKRPENSGFIFDTPKAAKPATKSRVVSRKPA